MLVSPVPELRWNQTIWVDSMVDGFGGNGANTSYTLARLGVPSRLMGILGSDEAGDRIAVTLSNIGVDIAHVRRSPRPTPATVALVHRNGDRALLHRPGASADAFADSIELTPELTAGCSWFHLANPFALPALRPRAGELVAAAKRAGMSVAIDTGWDSRCEWLSVIGPCLPHADLLFTNEDEGRELTGAAEAVDAARTLALGGARIVVVKRGGSGCLVFENGESFNSPAFKVPVVDTTGAGDCFVGGFLAALLRGYSLASAARFANAVGALSVQHLGGVTGLKDWDETLDWMRRSGSAASF